VNQGDDPHLGPLRAIDGDQGVQQGPLIVGCQLPADNRENSDAGLAVAAMDGSVH
jgi:hypothetical protein